MSATSLFTVAILASIALHAFLRVVREHPAPARGPRTRRIASPSRTNWLHGRLAPRVATIVTASILSLVAPSLAAPPYNGPPLLVAAPQLAAAGAVIEVAGMGFDPHEQGVLTFDGDPTDMPSYRVRGNGEFDEWVTIPIGASDGVHTISAMAPGLVASVAIAVVLPDPTPAPTPTPTLSPRVTPSPTPVSTPTATPLVTPSPTPVTTPTASPSPTPASGGPIDHVFVVVMENRAYSQVWNTTDTPYTTSFVKANALASNYYAITHPSLPNYLHMYGGDDYGITTNCNPSSSCHIDAVSLADNLEAGGLTWKGYFEDMPVPCYISDSGQYVAHHNPFIYFDPVRTDAVRCASHVVNYAELAVDLASTATSPNFAMIVPNNCNNTHSCPIQTGDTWLSENLPPILASPACVVDTCLLVLTWDEDDNDHGNHILTVFAGNAARDGIASSVNYDHHSLLRTIEDVLGLPYQTANDEGAKPMNELLN